MSRIPLVARSLLRRLTHGTLSAQFFAAGGLLLLIAMVVAGVAISAIVLRATINHKAASTALFMQSIVVPFSNELFTSGHLSGSSIGKLDELMSSESFKGRFPYFEIWTPDGVIAYSNSSQIIGQRFPLPSGARRALQGDVVADYADLRAGEHRIRGFGTSYLEIYSPVRAGPTGRVVAVAEIHEYTEPLQQDIASLQRSSWAVVAVSTIIIMLGLYGIVRRGSRTIERQNIALQTRMVEAERLARLNEGLRDRLQRASARLSEINEQFIRTVGAELHDGPAQLLGFSRLKLDEMADTADPAARSRIIQNLKSVLSEALHEIRTIAKGLVLPDLAGLQVDVIILRAVRAHEARTESKVHVEVEPIKTNVSEAVRTCAFRFVQEGLNNAFRHGHGLGQAVSCELRGSTLAIAVANTHDGSAASTDAPAEERLGLQGLRNRVESLGGVFTARFGTSGEARITMSLELEGGLIGR